MAHAVIKYAGETLEIAQQCFGSTIETLLVEARSAGLSVGDPRTDSKWISIATSPFFPLAGTASEKPFAFNLDRDCLKGLLDWIVDRLAS